MRRAVLAAVVVALSWPVAAAAHPGGPVYRWVGDPVAPEARHVEVPDGITDVWTGDLQAVVSLAEGGVAVDLVPREAASLPDGSFANGNAYEVTVSAPTSGQLLLAVPDVVVGALYSADGATWSSVPIAGTPPGQVAVELVGNGLYVAVADHDVRAGGGSSMLGRGVLIGGPVVLVAVALLARHRRQEPEPAAA